MTKDEARNVPLTAEDGPITFRSKAHLIASVLGGLWDYPHKTEGVPVDLVRSWVDAVFDDHRRPHTPAPAGETACPDCGGTHTRLPRDPGCKGPPVPSKESWGRVHRPAGDRRIGAGHD